MIKHAISLILLAKIMANKKQGRVTYEVKATRRKWATCTSTGANGTKRRLITERSPLQYGIS